MITLFLFLAAVVERINELTFGRVFGDGKKFPDFGWLLPFTALGYGLALGFVGKLTILNWAAGHFGAKLTLLTPYADYFVSGVLISGGASYLHQLITKFAPEKNPTPTPDAVKTRTSSGRKL
jgi:hypothetical protein